LVAKYALKLVVFNLILKIVHGKYRLRAHLVGEIDPEMK
jgi:hypothetical protein